MNDIFDLIVIGGGHAGIEAAWAGSRLGIKTALLSMETSAIGRMSCNPAIGGVAKGQIVRDIDALGGLMGVLSDKAGIQFRMLNSSKGPAVWGPRAQEDMDAYSKYAQEILKGCSNLELLEGELSEFKKLSDGSYHIKTLDGSEFTTKSLVITTGTFLGAIMHTGLNQEAGGRFGEAASDQLSKYLKTELGLKTRRLKTGTPARLVGSSLNYDLTEIQYGDESPTPFSFRTDFKLKNEATCWITRTSELTHKILKTGFDRSPMFTGKIKGLGPRYCPSIEDKISRFSDKNSHQLFLEPEGLDCDRIYVNGFSSSLPPEIQTEALRTIPGLENCEIIRTGYAVEYDAVDATQLQPTMEFKTSPGLYFAGQVNGTSGYEEAAGQGLIAGVNAALKVKGEPDFILGRADSYIGVMVDDLVTLDIAEPYRMFTSRAEYRLHLRQDNAEQRLMEKGFKVGLAERADFERYQESFERIQKAHKFLSVTNIKPKVANSYLSSKNESLVTESVKAMALLKRTHPTIEDVLELSECPIELNNKEQLELYADELYRGFFERQARDIEKQMKMEHFKIPIDFDFHSLPTMSMEARNKLTEFRPLTVGLAKKIAGVRPADISILLNFFTQKRKKSSS